MKILFDSRKLLLGRWFARAFVIRAFPLAENDPEVAVDELNLRYQRQRIDCSTSAEYFRRFFALFHRAKRLEELSSRVARKV